MLVNADRKGPKDMIDLAQKAQAYKGLLDAKKRHEANPSDGSQKHLDDAFEAFTDLHHGENGKVDTGAVNATINLLNEHIAKGKAH